MTERNNNRSFKRLLGSGSLTWLQLVAVTDLLSANVLLVRAGGRPTSSAALTTDPLGPLSMLSGHCAWTADLVFDVVVFQRYLRCHESTEIFSLQAINGCECVVLKARAGAAGKKLRKLSKESL